MRIFPSHPVASGILPAAARRQRGVALVVTLILLSVITFLAVAFLFLSRRERGAVAQTIAQTTARRATEAGVERATAEVVRGIISSTNPFNYDLRVSTSFKNPGGFQPGVINLWNVNYDYLNDGNTNLGAANWIQNIANLYYDPRPPVFVNTNTVRSQGPAGFAADFRYYLDLNRNGRYDTNGLLPVLTGNPLLPYVDRNGVPTAVYNQTNILFSFKVGDPEWIGLLQRPDRPHSSSNLFVSRYAYIVVPEGRTLDVNTIHNQSKLLGGEAFSRNMGFGTWELNLASFFADLNTNFWGYNYDTNIALPSSGFAFDDALAITLYRNNGGWNNLRSVNQLFGAPGVTAFQNDMADGYGRGPLYANTAQPTVDGDLSLGNVNFGWPGDDNPKHYFTTQDLFDSSKSSAGFVNRLKVAGLLPNNSDYDRYTFYRLLAQLGTDSAPEPADKMHLNYVNVDAARNVVPDAQTNFIPWQPRQFFTNAADRILGAIYGTPAANMTLFGVNAKLSITNIPVMVSNRFVYTPALHRCLQLAANMYDASTDRMDGDLHFPSVFRPTFRREPNPFTPGITDIYINGFEEVGKVVGYNDTVFVRPLDLNDAADRAVAGTAPLQNIYGVPWVIGAKKGFPNFNEFAMQSVSQISRKIQIRKPTVNGTPVATNQMFVLGVSNVFAFEAWNSYRTNFNRDLQILVANDMTMALAYTNDAALDPKGGRTAVRYNVTAATNLLGATKPWPGYGPDLASLDKTSFQVPLSTNILFLPDSIYRTDSGATVFTTNIAVGLNLLRGFEQTGKFHEPKFDFAVSNRIRFIMIDSASGRVLDYVQLNDANGVRNLTEELNSSTVNIVDGNSGLTRSETIFWQTNRFGGNTLQNVPMGVKNQIDASLGIIDVADWNSVGVGQASGLTKQKEIDGFRLFMGLSPKYNVGAVNTNSIIQVPFTPTRKTSQYITWQANDPLVHYTVGDITFTAQSSGIRREQPNGPIYPIPNIGDLNDRFEPWGGNPKSSAQSAASSVPLYSVAAKDPGVRASDDWDFSTNKYPTIGMLGRVHRGTPWQTVYLKSEEVDQGQWNKWTGNRNALDSLFTRPAVDRVLFDVFTTAVSQNATRGQLNVNQDGLAAWSALLGGVIALTNTSTDADLNAYPPVARLEPLVIAPAGASGGPNSAMSRMVDGINRTRGSAPFNGFFSRAGDVLATPELTVASPFLNTNSTAQLRNAFNDATYERLPQMLMGLVRGNDLPRFSIYAYGQSLQPAAASRVMAAGPYFNLCTNYQITAEFATRTVVRLEKNGAGWSSVVESFNVLPPE